MSFTDKTLQCADCGANFTFSAEEQERFAARGYTNEPKRCYTCREARRERRQDFGFGSDSYSYRRREMYPVVCAACGAETRVPFQPRGDRPVYCSACYSKTRPGSSRR
ncbi:MAG TPA: zinc-binding protein [Dehalococcoidia bacterium]|nr:zinc-binding protein [Dehalococcoidia bacterium]